MSDYPLKCQNITSYSRRNHNASPPDKASELAAPAGYDAWLTEVQRLAKEELAWSRNALSSFPNWDGLREAFDEGLTPKEYWAEEYAAAS